MEQNMQSSSNALVKKLWVILSVFVFLLPVFFVPVAGVSLYVAKITLLATGLVAIFAVFLSSVLSSGVIEIPRAKYLIPIGVFALVALVSSLISGAISSSITGSFFDLGTSGSLVMLVFALFLTMFAVKSVGVVGKVVSAFIYSAIVLAGYTLLGTFGGALLPASLASRMPVFLAGGVIDMAIIFGAATILALCAMNMTDISKRMRIIFSVLMAFSVVFIGATNFMPVIIILGVISLVFFVYILSWSVGKKTNENEESFQTSASSGSGRQISLSSLVVLIAAVVLMLGGSNIGGYLANFMKVQTTEVRPNFQTTMDLAVTSWKNNFAFGVGPNRFAEFWAANKPIEINQTQFWNSDFLSGSGFIPTIAITTGLLGLLSLLTFIVMYVVSGVKAIFAQINSSSSRYLATSSFLVSLYLWIMLFLYTPSITVLALAFIFTGLFTSTLVPQGIIGLWKINIFSNPKTNFLSVLSIVVFLIMSVAGGYFVWEKAIATVVFESGVAQYQKTGNIADVRDSTVKALSMVQSDVYWRGLAEISLLDLNRVLASVTKENPMTETTKAEAQTLIANSIESAKKAVEVDSGNFQNWFALGGVYEALAQNGIEGSLDTARTSYNEAALRSPSNPSVPLALARLDVLSKNTEAAKTNISKALSLKNNYTDAYFALAQIEIADNNINGAIKSVEAAAVLDPNNSGLYFQLGLLKYNQKDYAGAVGSFERAVALTPNYANAKYFLGISYYQLDRNAEAIKQFEEISATDPNNQEVNTILANMKAGKSLFQTAKPADSKPPVKEN
ncbi:MAG: tetratricopeptide repeat protein [Candidatus Paceibacterota bacterium]